MHYNSFKVRTDQEIRDDIFGILILEEDIYLDRIYIFKILCYSRYAFSPLTFPPY